jgi:hypothetical protein
VVAAAGGLCLYQLKVCQFCREEICNHPVHSWKGSVGVLEPRMMYLRMRDVCRHRVISRYRFDLRGTVWKSSVQGVSLHGAGRHTHLYD